MATSQVFSVPQQAIGRAVLLAPMPKVALFLLSAPAERDLGFRARSIAEGMREVVEVSRS